jgi:uncharacterized protein (TIGR02099 family)
MTLQLRAYSNSVVQRLSRPPWRHGLRLAWQGAVALGGSAFCLLLLGWLTLQWLILPHIEDWRPMMERRASEAIGVPVHIGAVSVKSSGWIPAIELRDVVLSDPSGPEALRLPRVAAAITPRSVLSLHPRFAQLYVEGARLIVRRDAQGRLHVGGLDMAKPASTTVDSGPALDWFFRQQEVVFRHGALRWIDEARQAPPLALEDVDVVFRNGLRTHQLRVDATPPPAWGDRFAVRMKFTQPLFAGPGNWRRWSGTLYVDLPRGDVAQLRRHVDLPFSLDSGHGALRAWMDVQNAAWRAVTVDLRLQDLDVRFASTLQPLAIARAEGRLSARRDADGASLSVEHLGFTTAEGVVWPAGDLKLSWRQRAMHVAAAASSTTTVAPSSPSSPAVGVAADTDASALSVLWSEAAHVTGGQLSADRLDLALMARLAGSLPLPPTARQWLAESRPEGIVRQLSGRWDGSLEHPSKYRAAATLEHVSIAAGPAPAGDAPARPGWRNASMQFDASETGGHATLALDGGALELPGLFDQPVVPFDRLGATIDWKIAPDADASHPARLSLDIGAMHFANADAEGELQLHWRSGEGPAAPAATATAAATARPGSPAPAPAASAASAASAATSRFPGWMDLHGTLQRGRASQIARYLPRALPADTRAWLRDAFKGGDLSAVKFTVRGDLDDFPFRRGKDGEFRIATHVENLGLDYVPAARPADDPDAAVASDWPMFRDVKGDVLIDHGVLEIRNARARQRDIEIRDVQGTIRPLFDKPTLSLKGHARGPLADFLRYEEESPVGGLLGHALKTASGTGLADLDIALDVPLFDAERTTVHGSLALAGNDVHLFPGVPLLANVRGTVDFTQAGFTVAGAQVRTLGGETVLDGGMSADGAVHFTAAGVATADGLRHGLDDPFVARLGPLLYGQAPYRLQIGVLHGLTEFTLTSPLAGLGVNLPAPLAKLPTESWPLRVQSTLAFDPAGRANPRDTVRVELGTIAQAELQREYVNGTTRVQRAAYALGGPLPAAQPGGVAQLRLGTVNADAWWAAARALSAGPAPSSPAGAAGSGAPPPADALADAWPRSIGLRAQDLFLGGKHLTAVNLQIEPVAGPDGERWRAAMESEQTHGIVEYRPAAGTRNAHVYARLDRLALASSDAPADLGAAGAPSASPTPPASVPALDIAVDHFELNGKALGRLEVAATQADGARDWRLDRLSLVTPEATLAGSGVWSAGTTHRMALDFTLALSDSGAYLERLGFGRVLKGGKGKLGGKLSWLGSPLALDYPSLTGQLQLEMEAGQFLKANAGAGRLLGILSLQSLPRRLLFDFRDLFDEGFAFDNVDGDVQIERGVASTNNLRLRSVSAAVLMEGHTDLRAETQDLHVVVVPEINAGTASLAYAVINPVVGLGTFLAQMFLRKPLMAAGTRELHVTGSWSDPKVEPLERHVAPEPEGAASAAAAAAAAASKPAGEAARAASGTIAP